MALMEGLDMGSDHDVFFEGTWQIPGLYLHDWPDRYIHTNYDLAANIDPTKLKRAAFIGAVSAWFLANMSDNDVPAVLSLLERNALKRSAELIEYRKPLGASDAAAVTKVHFSVERHKVHSVQRFATVTGEDHATAMSFISKLQTLLAVPGVIAKNGRNETIYERNPNVKGPMRAFGYSYLSDKYDPEKLKALRLPKYTGTHGSSGEYMYEALNFVNGIRTVSDIRDWLTAELGPVPVEYVAEYLLALESIGVVR